MWIHFLLTHDLESPSGVGRYLPLARSLVTSGHRVTISGLHPDYHNLQDRSCLVDGIEVEYVGPMHVIRTATEKTYYSTMGLAWVVLRSTLGLVRSALRSRAGCILVGKPHPMNSLAGLIGKWIHRARLIIDFDDYEAASTHVNSRLQQKVLAFFEDHMASFADVVTTNTFFTRDRLKSLGVEEHKIRYLSNGIDPMWFKPVDGLRVHQLRKDLDLEGRQVVAFIGSLSTPNHPVDLLVEAFQMALDVLPGIALLLVGGGNAYERLRSKVGEMGLTGAVRFTGRVPPDQVPLYYRMADVSVDPVMDDDAARGRQPLKLFESWVSGVPFITGEVGDRKLLSGDPPAIYLCRPSDARALAEAIVRVLCDEGLRDRLRSQGLIRIHQYAWPVLARKLAADLSLEL